MALTKSDLQAIDGLVEKRVDELARLTQAGFEAVYERFSDVDAQLRVINKRLDGLDEWRADFRDLVRLLAEKKVLSAEEATNLHVHLERPRA